MFKPLCNLVKKSRSTRPTARRMTRLRLEALETRDVPSATHIGVVRPSDSGSPVFSLDSNGNGVFDANDTVFSYGLNSDKFLVGDWNGSGYDKIGVVRPQANGTDVFSLDSNGNGVFDAGDQVFSFGLSSDTVLVGDWNGDGKAKVGVVRNDGFGGATVILDSNGKGAADPNNAGYEAIATALAPKLQAYLPAQ